MARTSPALLLALAAGLAASLTGVLLWTLLRQPAPSIAPSGGPTPEAGERSEAELAPVSTGAGRSAPDAPAAETPAVRLGTASPEEPAATVTPSISIWGVVRERATGEGLFACAVRLGSAEPVLTDAAGRFVVQLEDIANGGEDLRVVRVTRAERGVEEVLFLGTVRVQPGLEILVEPSVVLRLHIVDNWGKAVRAVRVAAVLDSERLREVRWFVASTRESSDPGRFEIRARVPLPPPDALVLQVELDAQGPDVSREGVQRDILPIVEGTSVSTKHGMVKTDHVLFIGAGAFHASKPSDLIPELQGRFPIRVELDALNAEDFVRILTEPKNALVRQYTALLASEGVRLSFTADAVTGIAEIAGRVNAEAENIGARRLHTVMTTLLEDNLFRLPDPAVKTVRVSGSMVRNKLKKIVENKDLTRYIL